MTKAPANAAYFERDVIPLLEPLYWQAFRMTSAHVDAEDLLQETVLKAYAGRDSFQPGTNFKAWLSRIMTNAYISSYRTKKRQPAQNPIGHITDQLLLSSAAYQPAVLRSAEDQALEMIPDPELKAAMMLLPNQFRLVLYFADVAGFSYKEIAAMMGTQQGTVSSRLNRGRRQLLDLLVDSSTQPGVEKSARHRRGRGQLPAAIKDAGAGDVAGVDRG